MLSGLKSTPPIIQFLIYTLIGILSMTVLAVLAMIIFFATSGQTLDLSSTSSMDGLFTVNFLKVLQILQAVGLFIVPFLVYKLVNREDVKYPVFGSNQVLLFVVLFGLIMFCAYPVINAMAEWNQSVHLPDAFKGIDDWMRAKEAEAEALIEQFLVMDSVGDLLFNLLVIAILPAIGEELFFRGMMQSLFHKWFKNAHIAVWVVAIFFSAFHLQFLGFVPRMVLGAVLGYAAVYSGSLIVPIVGHFVNNGLAVILTYIYGIDAMSSDASVLGSNTNDWIYVTFSAIVLIGGMFLMKRMSQGKQPT